MRKSNYSFGEKIYNVMCLINTKIHFPNSRLIRTPIIIRGKQYISFGNGLTTGKNCQFEVNGEHKKKCLIFGDNVNLGHNVRLQCTQRIEIGSNVLMGSRVLIIDNSHGNYSGKEQDNPNIPPNKRKLKSAPIKINDNVWIGEGVVVQEGVVIGEGSIVAANSVVTKNVSSNTIVGGVPAKELKKWNERMKIWE